jgi:3-hydroxybutyryl-CoA dehydrogenase
MNRQCIGVVGAGIMGTDVALDLSGHNYQVLLKDLTDELLDKARTRIEQQYRLVKMMKKNALVGSVSDVLSRITFVTDYDRFDEVNIVVENVTESFEVKERVYAELRDACGDDVIFGVNTSCISITRIASRMPKPQNVIGMHFLNPVPLKELVEVVRGYHTTDETVEMTRRFLKSLNKRCIVVNDHPGFVTNRVLMLTINECVWLVHDGVASPADVDTIFKVGFGHKMGPLATADLIGLDTILNSLLVLHESYKDPKFRPCPMLHKMVYAGLLGQKSGKGFFTYRVKMDT